MDELRWFGVPAPEIGRWWSAAEPFVTRALAQGNGEFAPADVREAIGRRAMQLWLLWDGSPSAEPGSVRGAVVTEIVNYPRLRSCCVRLFAADPGLREAWLPMLKAIEEWARAQGCAALEAIGRPGWERVLPFRKTHVVLRKELNR